MREQQPPDDPRHLILRAKAGDSGAFGKLYEVYFTPVFRYISYRVRTREEAEDLVQIVFLKTYQALSRFAVTDVPPLAYLFRVARNAIIDAARKKREVALREPEEELAAIPDLADDPHEAALKNEAADVIRRAVRELTEEQQDVVTMRHAGGLSYMEIAAALGKTEEAVRQLHHRAIRALRERTRNLFS